MNLSAIIVDDEQRSRENLVSLLAKFCPRVEVLGEASNANEARFLVRKHNPDAVFLDIQMPKIDGFRFLEMTNEEDFFVVFVTAFSDYGIKAIKASAVDYLLKPIDPEELILAVHKLEKLASQKRRFWDSYKKSLLEVVQSVRGNQFPSKITLPKGHGFILVETDKIVRIQAESNYCFVHIETGEKFYISKTLKEIEEVINPSHFIRISRSDIINLCFLKSFSKEDGGRVLLKNGTELMIARRRIGQIVQKVKEYSSSGLTSL
jgi:two-component system LytT family response regulator